MIILQSHFNLIIWINNYFRLMSISHFHTYIVQSSLHVIL